MIDLGVGPLVSVWLADLDGTVRQAQNVNHQHYAASLVKLPIALAAYRMHDRGELDLDAVVPVHPDFASAVEGERFEMHEAYDQDPETWAADTVPLRELVARSLARSGNLAANLVLEQVGPAEVAAVLADAGCSPMTEVGRAIEDAPAEEAGLTNLMTAHDAGRLLAGIAERTLASAAACQEVEQVLTRQRHRDGIPLGLPEGTAVANKTGWVDGVRHDIALVRPDDRPGFVLAILTSGLDDDEAEWRISELARFLWQSAW
ncbi:beta-lactamase class A [Nocardioides terrae]|uniref:Beta-lactamase class A n=1 Tax=Nocardioides terrae TaxID=574651 RepID=A0A1I1LH78_9ACTN|nr:serine hydrolase [Nocardioides terrae]SFC72351.1 beta-lactamase class A [Nocardioides terrae]